mmetsp:Transcript_109532/g.316673  ORF Transcript_109532/g.316673 Transcript_109532/m.316673 type:complete len:226 (+) Transcript_109532:387-1064(+)
MLGRRRMAEGRRHRLPALRPCLLAAGRLADAAGLAVRPGAEHHPRQRADYGAGGPPGWPARALRLVRGVRAADQRLHRAADGRRSRRAVHQDVGRAAEHLAMVVGSAGARVGDGGLEVEGEHPGAVSQGAQRDGVRAPLSVEVARRSTHGQRLRPGDEIGQQVHASTPQAARGRAGDVVVGGAVAMRRSQAQPPASCGPGRRTGASGEPAERERAREERGGTAAG